MSSNKCTDKIHIKHLEKHLQMSHIHIITAFFALLLNILTKARYTNTCVRRDILYLDTYCRSKCHIANILKVILHVNFFRQTLETTSLNAGP